MHGELDPQAVQFLRDVESSELPPFEALSPQAARVQYAESRLKTCGPPEPIAFVKDYFVSAGEGQIAVRVYAPKSAEPLPLLVYYHGGGWVIGDLDTHDTLCRSLANVAGCVVVAVDYRLAPEHPFPAAINDALTAFQWVVEHAARFGGDSQRMAVGGDSAGGALATVVSAKCRKQENLKLKLQMLIYPATDLSSTDTPSYRDNKSGYLLTQATMNWFRQYYLSVESDALHPDASPYLIEDLTGMPPTYMITAEFDPLRDEGEAYARRLQSAGVPVQLKRYAGMIHGFVPMVAVFDRARDAIVECASALKLAFAARA